MLFLLPCQREEKTLFKSGVHPENFCFEKHTPRQKFLGDISVDKFVTLVDKWKTHQ